MARDRRAALGDRDRRRRDRGGADGAAPGRGDAVRRLRLVRLGPPRHRGGEAALPRRDADPDRAAPPLRRRILGRAVPLAEPRELVRAHPGPQGRLPGDAGGCEGPARHRDRGPEPGALLRAQAPLPPDQGRGARRALHDAVRQGAHPPRRRRRHGDHLGRDGLHRRRGGGDSSSGTTSRSRSSTCAR